METNIPFLTQTFSVPQNNRPEELTREVVACLTRLHEDQMLLIAVQPVLGNWESASVSLLTASMGHDFVTWVDANREAIIGTHYFLPELTSCFMTVVASSETFDNVLTDKVDITDLPDELLAVLHAYKLQHEANKARVTAIELTPAAAPAISRWRQRLGRILPFLSRRFAA